MAKKSSNKMLVVLGAVVAFFAFKPKANATNTTGKQNATNTNNTNAGGGTSTGSSAVTVSTDKVEQTTLSGVQTALETVLYPSSLNKDTETEKPTNGINWNFGMIAKTSKKWAGEVASTSSVKMFINRFAGLGAMMYLLWVYINNKKLDTITKIGNSWASRNKETWIAKISEYSGLKPDETLQADSSYLFKLCYAIALYYQPMAKNYISNNTLIVSLEYMSRNYKINVE